MHTIKKKFKGWFCLDNDQSGNNMFLHPYHGNLYYNSARSRGFNYWESAFALGGSAMWELFMENEYPSINDIIATPIGGLSLGEVFLSNVRFVVLDDRREGSHRFGRELAAFVIAPTRGLTRILNGDAWRRRSTTGKQFGVPDVSVEVSAGVRVLELKGRYLAWGRGCNGCKYRIWRSIFR